MQFYVSLKCTELHWTLTQYSFYAQYSVVAAIVWSSQQKKEREMTRDLIWCALHQKLWVVHQNQKRSANTVKVSFCKVRRGQGKKTFKKSSKNFISVMNRESYSRFYAYWKTTLKNVLSGNFCSFHKLFQTDWSQCFTSFYVHLEIT